ncbi:MAG: hypothetical protein CL912_13880 [Deltaproteobacteria bacterium]|nr:hypothetical protein [Deltaproteobacteria bacterium]|tara:strand:+ start:579 stop:1139 length:561 start_codon:yes stop_codon:yes gene_type:complete
MTSLSRIASQVEEVDEQTFVRFCEYAYMGDYTPAQQQIVLPSSKLDNGECQIECYCGERAFPAHKKDKKRKGGSKFADDVAVAVEEYSGRCSLETPTQKLWDEFQCRAYSVVSPKFITDRMEKVIELARFSYCNKNTRDNEARGDLDNLRRMVVHFVVCVFGTIVKDDKFLGLMEEGGCFARDLIT